MTGILAAMNTPTGPTGQIPFEEGRLGTASWLVVLGVQVPALLWGGRSWAGKHCHRTRAARLRVVRIWVP
jgi:hypothetical protein